MDSVVPLSLTSFCILVSIVVAIGIYIMYKKKETVTVAAQPVASELKSASEVTKQDATPALEPDSASATPASAAPAPAPAPAPSPAQTPASGPAPFIPPTPPPPPVPKKLPDNINFVVGYSGGAHENPPDNKDQSAEDCRQKALNSNGKYVAWGYRTNDHPDPAWKNTCFLYTSPFNPYKGNSEDKAHQTGCLNPEEKVEWGCKTTAPKQCPPGTNDSGTTCWYDRGVGTVPGCGQDKVQKGVECYDKPPGGYDWTTPGGLLIGKICPKDTNDSGTTCWYDRGVGTVPGCAPGKVQKGVECYDPPQPGYDWTTPGGLLVGKICPPGTNDSGTTCWYDRGVGKPPTCPPGKVQKGVECYDPPPQGYDWTTPGGLLIGKICPPGSNDSGTTCWYDRGVGQPPSCPPGQVRKGIECYNPPPAGYDWTTPGGLLIGKICPPGTNDSGTTCWYDRGVGRIPDKRPCAEGLRDDGTSCWKDTYGRGTGRTPDKAGCPNGWRDDGTSCWEDWKCNTWWDNCANKGPKGQCMGGLKTNCGGCGCIKRTLFDRQSCRGDEEKNGALCYPKCKPGYRAVGCCLCEPNDGAGIKTTLFQRQYCRNDEDLIGGLCYKKPRDGFGCAATHCKFSKDVKPGQKVGLIASCPPDRVLQDGMCYLRPRDGYDCAVTHCKFGKDVKPGNKVGLVNSCPPDRVLQDGMCYIKPKDGFDCAVTHCKFGKDVKPGSKVGLITSCPPDRQLEAGMCYTKPRNGFDCAVTHCKFGKDVKPGNKVGLITSCPPDRQLEAGMCYTKPKDGFNCAVTHCKFNK